MSFMIGFPVVPRPGSPLLPRMDVIGRAEASALVEPQRVWDRLADGLRWAAWSEASEWMVVENALEAGQYVTIKRKRGRQTAYLIETADAPSHLAFVLAFGPMAYLRIAWTLTADAEGTQIVQTVESGGPLRRWLSEPLARKAALSLAGDPVRLAELAASP